MSNRRALLAKAHIAVKQLGLGEDEHRALIRERYPDAWEGSCRELSDDQLGDYLEHLEALGFRPRRRKQTLVAVPPGGSGVITPGQRRKIDILLGQVRGIRSTRENYLSGICWRLLGYGAPRTRADGSRVIEALRGVRARQMLDAHNRGSDAADLAREYGLTEREAENDIARARKRAQWANRHGMRRQR